MDNFYLGIFNPSKADFVDRACVSINVLERRRSIAINNWILDCGGYTTILKYGKYPDNPETYARKINHWSQYGNLVAAASQDWLCLPSHLERTGLTVDDHQRLTIERYEALDNLVSSTIILPTLQGLVATDYVSHLYQYGNRLQFGQWVGVGSLKGRSVESVEIVLAAIKSHRPDLRLHGFGCGLEYLASSTIFQLLHSADSMAWSYNARRRKRKSDCTITATDYYRKATTRPVQLSLLVPGLSHANNAYLTPRLLNT